MPFRRLAAAFAACALAAASPALAYQPITPKPGAEAATVVLTGHDLTIDSVLAVARDGAKVKFSDKAIADAEAGRGLLAEGNAEGIAIYGTNRGPGALREVRVTREADGSGPTSGVGGSRNGALPEIDEEVLVRAFMVIQANHWPYNAATREFMTGMTELLNRRVTPVMYSRGTIGEGDLFLTSNYLATLYGHGEAYYQGQRMSAADALSKAGLKPLTGPTGGGTTNAYATALALMLVADGKQALDWADMGLAFNLLGMNSSVTPLTPPVQARRPFPWVNWEAAKLLEVLKDSYLMQDDDKRILQDSESLRASHIRLGSAWQAWAALRDAVTLQMNSGEQNPAVILDAKPTDANLRQEWVLATPWVQKYHVKGGPASNGRSGYVMSNANWDPYPMTNEVEAFNLALANMAVTVASRIDRFSDRGPTAFFTAIKPAELLTPEQMRNSTYMQEPFFAYLDVWKEMQMLTQSVPPDSSGSDFGVADLEAVGRLKASRGRQAVDLFMQLEAYDVTIAAFWLDLRKLQTPARTFGGPATAALAGLRQVLPAQQRPEERASRPFPVITYDFIKSNPAAGFLASVRTAPAMPAGLPIPAAR